MGQTSHPPSPKPQGNPGIYFWTCLMYQQWLMPTKSPPPDKGTGGGGGAKNPTHKKKKH